MKRHTVAIKNAWSDASVTEQDVVNLIRLYNTLAESHGSGFKSYIRITKNLLVSPKYKDAVRLLRFINYIGAQPREYIVAQFNIYCRQNRHINSRGVPSLKMLSSPRALTRWVRHQAEEAERKSPSHSLSQTEVEMFNQSHLAQLMKQYKSASEEEFFKDVVLASQFALEFLQTRSAFNSLVATKYYEKTYNVTSYMEFFN